MKAKLITRTITALTPQNNPYEVWDTDIKGYFLRVQPSGVMSYNFFYRTTEGAKRRTRIGKVGTLTPAQARDVAVKMAADVAHGKDLQADKKQARIEGQRAKLRTLSVFLDQKYAPWAEAERRTGAATVKRIKSNFGHLLNKSMMDVTEWAINKWRLDQRKRGKAVSTMNRDVVALKAALSKAVEWGLIDSNPLAKVKPEKIDKVKAVRYLSADEENSLRDALDERERQLRESRDSGNEWRRVRGYQPLPDLVGIAYADHIKPMALLSLNTGMRRGEVFSLRWDAVNFDAAMLTVHGHTAKSAQTRHIPLNDEALEVLIQWRKQSNDVLVFPGIKGKPLVSIRKAWLTVLGFAGIVGFRWHDLRHSFASKLVMAGVDLNTVRELLGHGDIAMTLRYAHLAPEHKAAAVAKLIKPCKIVGLVREVI